MKHLVEISGAPKPIGPYSAAVWAGDTLYLSGQIPLDPESMTVVQGGVAEQATQVMENLKAVLASQGLSFENVAMTTIFLTDIADGKAVNEVYASYMTAGRAPARQTVAVRGLPMGVLVEISMIAAKS